MVFRIRADIKAAQKGLSKLEKSLIPKAARNALNDTAFDVRKFVVFTLYPRSFPRRRNRRFPGVAFRVSRKARTGALRSEVSDVLDRFFIPLQIEGGLKVARGRYLAIPTRHVRRTQRGVAKNERPDQLRGSFIADLTGRGPAIWQRDRKHGLRLMYVLEPAAKIREAFPFYRLGYAKGRQRWPIHFDREVKHALSKVRSSR